MEIAHEILSRYSNLNENQKSVVGSTDGPLLVIAGPGSGKTFSIVLRTLNLLLLRKAEPKEIVLCTFTEKAAFEMRDRIASAARKLHYKDDLSELTVTTIHGLCNQILAQNRHRTQLGFNYEILTELTQLIFIFEHFDEIIGQPENNLFLKRWRTRWTAIEGARGYFNKITEELVDSSKLLESEDSFLTAIGLAYRNYARLLTENSRVDFAHLQLHAYQLLEKRQWNTDVPSFRYVLVDEYQDTNYIQEQLLLNLVDEDNNLCVVGDEDQSLYRFRGATVRNILEFSENFSNCTTLKLTTNYRSHRAIIERYDNWMASADWSNKSGSSFRFDKTIVADQNRTHSNYPPVINIWGSSPTDEAGRFADFVHFLKISETISDYSQIALLLHSVREEHSGPYLTALEAMGIPAFCPRSRGFFKIPEIRYMVACFAILFDWYGEKRGQVRGSVIKLSKYVDEALVELVRKFATSHPLLKKLQELSNEINKLKEGESLNYHPADIFYKLLAIEPFKNSIQNENIARNLAIFSDLLNVFQGYYHYSNLTYRNCQSIRYYFFNSFIRFLYDGGINEYEDPDQPFPQGYVQVMTIHQAKGLEFPIVVVGSLSAQLGSQKKIDRDLSPFYSRLPFEPEQRITQFDRMRLHYVAFSRAKDLLVLTASKQPKSYFASMWQGLPQWPYVEKDSIAKQNFDITERTPIKRVYSFTGDLKIYETCPRQYQFFREYQFTPSRSAVIFFGLLVHQSIEAIHRVALDKKLETLNKESIRNIFEQTFRFLKLSNVRPIGVAAKKEAFNQVMNYFRQNKNEMHRIIATEVDVSLEKDNYILAGKVDLLLNGTGNLELLDFKTRPRPKASPELITAYEKQLCTYAHILERRYGKQVDKMFLYWTSEANKKDALMPVPFRKEQLDLAGRDFDSTVHKIQSKMFSIDSPPEAEICKECDLRALCSSEGIIGEN